MKTLTFHNETKLDAKAFQIMGLSVKGENSIGMFGTGMKYAIATILRLGDSLTIHSGDETFEFGTQDEEFRGEPCKLVTCNGDSLNFTVDLGKNWQAWMAYRELASNAWDEGGDVTRGASKANTRIIVKGSALYAAHLEQSKNFIRKRKPVWETAGLEIYRGNSPFLFCKGVRVYELQKTSQFSYNITQDIKLTEDRTIENMWTAQNMIGDAISKCEDREIISQILDAIEFGWESNIHFYTASEPSETFLDEVEKRYKATRQIPSGFGDVFKSMRKEAFVPAKLTMTQRQQRQVDKAVSFLGKAGYEIDQPIFLVESEGERIIGQAKNGEIWLMGTAFERGTFDLASTILEEYAHNKTGYGDETRALQDWLFRQIILQSEKVVDEVL